MKRKSKQENRQKRHRKIRAKIKGTADKPRLSVFRSNSHIYAQLVDDEKGKTLVSAKDFEVKPAKKKDLDGKQAIAFSVGELIAQKAKKEKIKKVVFDRSGYKYHGRVKALADGARSQGLEF
jgi:large subunit ribosomal protein L18